MDARAGLKSHSPALQHYPSSEIFCLSNGLYGLLSYGLDVHCKAGAGRPTIVQSMLTGVLLPMGLGTCVAKWAGSSRDSTDPERAPVSLSWWTVGRCGWLTV